MKDRKMTVLGVESSFQGRHWKYTRYNEKLALAIARQYEIPEIVAQVLSNRINSVDEANAFLHPTLKNHLPNPFSLKDMEKSANRMAESVIKGEPIGLMGDYDVDGATSTAILQLFLQSIGTTVYSFIPDRNDGYGPNAAKMQDYFDKGCKVVATLDCGTTAFDVIDQGNAIGLDIIILDHHDTDKHKLPNAYGVVNPKRLDEDFNHPGHYMAAVGVVFLFVVGLNKVLRQKGFYKDKQEPNLMQFLDLVAFGTVCDVVKLVGVNRLFVKAGLNQLQRCQNIGLNELAKIAHLDGIPSSYHLGFMFGPRINAAGRVGQSDIGLKLLTCDDAKQAQFLAQELDNLNMHRREIELEVFEQATIQVESMPKDTPFIVVAGENWHQGVVGIVAGRLKDKYHLPVFALSIENDEVKGSSRSVPDVDIGAVILQGIKAGIITRGGGHPMAAGFTLKKDKIAAFKAFLSQTISPDMINSNAKQLNIDALIDMAGITPDLINHLELLAPYGEANHEPVFAIKNVRIARINVIKSGHISCTFANKSGIYLQAIAFRCVETPLGTNLIENQKKYLNVVGTLKKDTWRGVSKIQLQLIDASIAE